MADPAPATAGASPEPSVAGAPTRKEKRKAAKKLKRKQLRREAAIKKREEEEKRSNDPEEQRRIRIREEEEAEASERARREFEERERAWMEAAAARRRDEEEEEERRKKLQSEIDEDDYTCSHQELKGENKTKNQHTEFSNESKGDGEWDYIEEGPAEIIWQGNEIIVKKKKVKVAKGSSDPRPREEEVDRPTSNPLPPQSAAFASYKNVQSATAQEVLESVAQQVPNFGTEQDKAHCPFHLKTGACRFGSRCSRVHFYPDKSCTLLIKNMYNGPGLAWEQDEGLEYTDEEVERSYEEFYEDVHTEFLKYGELVNFKVCKNGSYHLRGNVYVHYNSMESAILAYNNINGRYFAGKQMTCEFVGVTRWKIAICGEYMKSRLKTCSRGTACNFIHCFRNPGGDYEWADWDNPPPKYWIKKMAVLFGPSDESASSKHMELEGPERPRSRDKSPIRKRSRRSYHRMEVYDSGSGREDSNRKRDRRSVGVEHTSSSSRRENHIHDHPGEDYSMEKDTKFLSEHQKVHKKSSSEGHKRRKKHKEEGTSIQQKGKSSSHEQEKSERKRKSKSPESHKRRKRQRAEDTSIWEHGEASSDEQEKSERKLKSKWHDQYSKECRSSDQEIDYTGDYRVRRESRSGDKSYSRHDIDAQDRYSERDHSDDSDSGRDQKSSRQKKLVQKGRETDSYRRNYSSNSNFGGDHKSSRNIKRTHEKRETDRYNSEHSSVSTTFDIEKDAENGKSQVQGASNHGFSPDASPNGWDITDIDSGRKETRNQSSHDGSIRSHKKHTSGNEKHIREKKRGSS